MKLALRIGLFAGLAIMIALILHEGASSILTAVSRAGLVILWLVPLHALPLQLDAMGWRLLIPGRPAASSLLLIAAIREAINRLLPAANVGGEIVGIRLLAMRGVTLPWAAASVAVEVLMTMVSQFLFVGIGLLCLLGVTGRVPLTYNVALGLIVSTPIIVLLGVLLRRGSAFGRIERLARGFLGSGVLVGELRVYAAQTDAAIHELCRAYPRLIGATFWQLTGLIVSCAETWLLLRWLGRPISVSAAVALESLTQVARHIIFFIPAGLGVQELGMVALGSILGLDSELAVALSLAKRVRELLFGVPALLAWQLIETRRGLGHERSGSGT